MLIIIYMGEIKMSNVQAVNDFRRKRKLNLIKVGGGCCNLCGYNKLPGALEFHHIYAEEKSYSISKEGTCHDLEKDLEEVKKCILVCANCHREIHGGLYTPEELLDKQVFDESVANSLKEEKEQRYTKTYTYCSNCGKQLPYGSKSLLCLDCFKKTRQSSNKPERETLKAHIRQGNMTLVGRLYGVSDNAIRKWCKSYNLPSSTREIIAYTDEEWQQI